MPARAARLAVGLAAALVAATAHAQWRTTPMVVWLDGPRIVLTGTFASGGGPGLLVLDPASSRSELRPHHDLLAAAPGPFAFPPASTPAFRAGDLAQAGADGLTDVARIRTDGFVEVAFGSAPATRRSYPVAAVRYPASIPSFVHLLPRPADVLVVAASASDPAQARVTALDFDPVLAPTQARSRTWSLLPLYVTDPATQGVEVAGVRLSPAARAAGIDDLAVMGHGGLVLLFHDGAPAAPTLDALLLSTVEVGGNRGGRFQPPWSSSNRPPWLPPAVPQPGDALGVAAFDVDLDGNLDLVFPQSYLSPDGTVFQAGAVWVKGTGSPGDFADPILTPWSDLGPELAGSALIVRQVSAGGTTGFATWDASTEEVVVVWNDGAIRRVWRAPAPGVAATDLRMVDLVGSAAPDLAVVVDNGGGPGAVLVYPDLGQPGPVLRWAPGSPGRWLRGLPLEVAVEVDPAGAPLAAVDWVGASPTTTLGSGPSHVFPGVCTAPSATLEIAARGTDPSGVFTTLTARLPLEALAPSLAAAGDGTLRLAPGGATAVFDATVLVTCGIEARFGGTPWPAGVTVTDAVGPLGIRRTVVLDEAAYPALLAEPAHLVAVETTDPFVAASTVVITVPLDASGLVEVGQEADDTALDAGQVTVIRTRLRSRIGVPIPLVRVVTVLGGLAVAGPPTVTGATLVSSERGGVEVVVSALPESGGEVVIGLPVRALRGGGGAAAEARSSAGWPLSAPARAATVVARRAPGCGCGTGSAPGTLALALVAVALRRRPRRAT